MLDDLVVEQMEVELLDHMLFKIGIEVLWIGIDQLDIVLILQHSICALLWNDKDYIFNSTSLEK